MLSNRYYINFAGFILFISICKCETKISPDEKMSMNPGQQGQSLVFSFAKEPP